MNDQLDRIEKMLRAQLRSSGHVWWIGGCVYGVTSNGDPFILLYPADEKLNEKVVRVYPHDFKKLPAFIRTEDLDGGDTEANPNKEQARRKGIYHECPPFEIVTFDGKETQMGRERRFGDVTRLSRKAAEADATAGGQGQRLVGPPAPTGPAQAKMSAQAPAAPTTLAKATTQPPPAEPDWEPSANSRPPSPAPQAPAAPRTLPIDLPDYRKMALGAKTAAEFDYAAFMVLQGELYTDQARIAQARESLIPAWRASERTNSAMLTALTVYRAKRAEADGGNEVNREARLAAQREARNCYNEEMK